MYVMMTLFYLYRLIVNDPDEYLPKEMQTLMPKEMQTLKHKNYLNYPKFTHSEHAIHTYFDLGKWLNIPIISGERCQFRKYSSERKVSKDSRRHHYTSEICRDVRIYTQRIYSHSDPDLTSNNKTGRKPSFRKSKSDDTSQDTTFWKVPFLDIFPKLFK